MGAGALGTLALSVQEPLRDALLGQPPPYSVTDIATRGAREWLGVGLEPRKARRWGLVLRWVYGPALGVLHGWLRPHLPPGTRLRGLTLGGGVWALELVAFPLLRLTSPPRAWSFAELLLLALQTSLFGLVTEAVLA